MTIDELIDGWQSAWSGRGGRESVQFAEVCAAGIQYEDPLTDEPLDGIDALTAHAGKLWAGFPDARLERTGERLFNDHFVAAPCKVLGTHRAPLAGLPPTNRFVVVHCIFYCELQHDLLLRVRGFFDVYDAATQLGVLPARGTMGEKALLMLRGFGLRTARS
ncbi:MAG: ester cyclase [Solirubrobacteraceae bacterium]